MRRNLANTRAIRHSAVVGVAPVGLSLTWDRVRGHRLKSHCLHEPRSAGSTAASAVSVASAVCGIHAQVGSAAALSLARRVRGAHVDILTDALWRDRSLVKTYGPRGTVHVVAAEELSLWTAAARALPGQGSRRPPPDGRSTPLTDEQRDQLTDAIRTVTRGTQLTRDELGAAIADECGPWVHTTVSAAWTTGWPHWRFAVDEEVVRGQLCFGPPQGNRVTFVRADEWVPDSIAQVWVDDDTMVGEAPAVLVEIARRFLAAYGPATHQEFAQWFAFPVGQARKVFGALGDELVPVDVAGYRSNALVASEPQDWEPVTGCIRLLGYFDCFAVGSHPRDELAPPSAAEAAKAHAAGYARGGARRFLCGPLPVLLVDGVVSGVWTYRQGDAEEVRVEVFGHPSARLRRLLADEVARLSAILDRDLVLSLGPADIKAHL